MARTITIFNNKGGVGKTVLCWNLADALGRLGKRVLLIDFDPQCNLSIAVLGEDTFVTKLPTLNVPYGTTIRAFLQRFLENTGGEEVFLHNGPSTHTNVDLLAGDFWLNAFADSLNVGADLLAGTALAKYEAQSRLVEAAETKTGKPYHYVHLDLPPSFGSLVRSALYSSDYFIVPCTSDNFSAYCVGLIGDMIPAFLTDWTTGLARFKKNNPHFTKFDLMGRPVFAGWVFNGFDTARVRRSPKEIEADAALKAKELVRADKTHHERITNAVRSDLVSKLQAIPTHTAVAPGLSSSYQIADVEDANVLIQNSLWLNVPLSQLDTVKQVVDLQNRANWAANQLEQIELIRQKLADFANRVVSICT